MSGGFFRSTRACTLLLCFASRAFTTSLQAPIRVDANLVLIPVAVTDPSDRPVTGLQPDAFRVIEDGVEQKLAYFSSEDTPVSIGIVFDSSGSMGKKLSRAREAAAEFLKAANPEDEFFLLEFNSRPVIAVPFCDTADQIQEGLLGTQSRGPTALLDAVYMAVSYVKKAAKHPRKALLVISDGGDNFSRYSQREIKRLLRETDVSIYSIGIYEPPGALISDEEDAGSTLLSDVSEETGGREFAVDDIRELPDVAAKIGRELRNQYMLGYYPVNREWDGKYRRVRIKLKRHGARVFWRPGYYAPEY